MGRDARTHPDERRGAPVFSFLQAVLADAGIEAVVLDAHTSVIEGSAGAIPRRVMVADDELAAAERLLAEIQKIRDDG